MEPLWIFLGVLIVVPLAIIFYAISIYNGLVSLRNGYENAFSQIDVQLTRRYDLIPNLVETAKGYMKHEKDTLEAVIEADRDSKNGMRKRQGEGSVPTGSHKVVVELIFDKEKGGSVSDAAMDLLELVISKESAPLQN